MSVLPGRKDVLGVPKSGVQGGTQAANGLWHVIGSTSGVLQDSGTW